MTIYGYGACEPIEFVNDYSSVRNLQYLAQTYGYLFQDIVRYMGHDPYDIKDGDFTPVEFLCAMDELNMFDTEQLPIAFQLYEQENNVYFYFKAKMPWEEGFDHLPETEVKAQEALCKFYSVLFGPSIRPAAFEQFDIAMSEEEPE